MRIIKKKTTANYFEKIKTGEKDFDVRLNEFPCSPGDILILKEWDPKNRKYTGRVMKKRVNFVLKTKTLEKFWGKSEIDKHGFLVIGFKK